MSYFVNGFDQVDVLSPDDVEGVEVYRSTAQAPVEYRRMERCGVTLVWLRNDVRAVGTAPLVASGCGRSGNRAREPSH